MIFANKKMIFVQTEKKVREIKNCSPPQKQRNKKQWMKKERK